MSQEPKVTRFGADPTVNQELATKAYVDAGGGGGQTFAKVVKAVDQIVNNSITFVDDDELKATLNINKEYSFILIVYANSSAVADFKYTYTIPSGATGTKPDEGTKEYSPGRRIVLIDIVTGVTVAFAGDNGQMLSFGRISMGATPGDLQVQFAQNTAEVSDTTMLQGSTLLVWED